MSSVYAAPDFWDERYRAGQTPWEYPGVPPALARFLTRHPAAPGDTALVPGCGSGQDLAALAAAGYAVTAMDFSATAIERARARVPAGDAVALHCADFFTCTLPAKGYTLVYERTFVCALDPARWAAVTARIAKLLQPGGRWVGLFYEGPKEDGPPFGWDRGEAEKLLYPTLENLVREPVPPAESPALFAGREWWREWRRPSGP
jgi:SAM-dependent methyltransferase